MAHSLTSDSLSTLRTGPTPANVHPMTALRLKDDLPQCVVCGGPSPYVCSECNADVTYCTPAHLIQDLFRHSLQCSHDRRIRRDDSARASQDALEILMSNDAWSASTATNEPPSDPPTTPPDLDCDYTVRGLYRRSPREDMSYVDVDVKCVSFPGDIGGPLCIPCLVPFVSPPAHVTTVTFGKDGRPLVKPLYIYASDESTCVQHNIGEFTVKTARGQLEVGRTHWGGPVLVLKYENVAMNSFMDIDDTDLADVSAFFTLS